MSDAIYDDGTYHVTAAIFATPRRFYPIANTTARIRRDPLWIGVCLAALAGGALAVYGDLLYPVEAAVTVVFIALSLLIGNSISLLSIDAWGHERATIVARTNKIRVLYRAIRDARTADNQLILKNVPNTENTFPVYEK